MNIKALAGISLSQILDEVHTHLFYHFYKKHKKLLKLVFDKTRSSQIS